MPGQLSSIAVRGVNVRVHRAGKGDPVLFLHGAGGVPAWLPFFDKLAERHELIVPEHPGFGGSDDPELIRNIGDLAYFYLDMIESEGWKDIHLVGTSMGGWIAAEMLVRDRARFKSLTVVSPAGLRVEGVLPGDNFIWAPEEGVRNLYHDQSFADRLLAVKPTDEEMEVRLKNLFTVTKLAWQPRWFNPDLEKWLHRIKLPALVVWGDDDKLMPPAYAKLWKERLPDARLSMIPACGHLPHVEKADAVAQQIQDFWKGIGR